MIRARLAFFCFLLCAPLVFAASDASTQQDVANNLKGKVVFLRGMESRNKLTFDAQGAATETVTAGPFALSAVKIEKVHQSRRKLEIDGNRVALFFHTASKSPSLNDLQLTPLPQSVTIVIAIDAAHPEALDAAIQRVFAFSVKDALAVMSPEQETAALDTIGSLAPPSQPKPIDPGMELPPGVYRVGAGVSPPRLTYAVDPSFTEDARRQKIGGVCVLSLIVDEKGRPTDIRVFRSIDPGLDRNAIAAAKQYRFKPATLNGKPVPVLINVEVNFRVY